MISLFNAWLHNFCLQWNKWLIGFVCLGCVGDAQASISDYDALIIQARQGNVAEATAWLDWQSRQRLLTVNEVADWLQINAWAGNDNVVIKLWQRYLHVIGLPVRAISAAAKSYRNLGQWSQSLELWRKALLRSTNKDDALSGLIMTLSDAGRHGEALHLALTRVELAPNAEHWRELAWVQSASGRHEDALASISHAIQRSNQNIQLFRDYSAILAKNRVSKPALTIGQKGELHSTELRQRQSDAAAELVRMSFLPSVTERERFAVADRALAIYETLFTRWRSDPAAQDDYRRARIDRLGALLARYRMAEVVAEYEDLLRAGDISAYAQLWAASAYLYLRRPSKAEQIYLAVQREAPHEMRQPEQNRNLFYSMAENRQIEQAQQQANHLRLNVPYYRHLYGSPVPVPNNEWLDAQKILTQSILLHNSLAPAQRNTERLASTAPGNQGLRIDLADIYLMRGWPRRAEMELKLAEGLGPRNVQLETQQGLAALYLQEWRQADLLADDVMARTPEDSSVQRFERLRRVHHMAELRISASQGIKSDSPVSGAHDTNIDTVLYSPPLADNWRQFSGFTFNQGDFEEGRGNNRHVRGGVEFTNRDNWLEAEISGQNYRHGQKIGSRISGWHDVNDSWRISASLERLMTRTPLRALLNGVTANGAEANLRWRPSERREWRLAFATGWFSDGNRRFEYSIEAKERLYSSSFLTLDFIPSLSGSHNSRSDVAYYSPRNDAALLPALTLDHLLYRYYQTEWHQEVIVGAGNYWQKGELHGAISKIGYGQRVLWNDVLEAKVMVNWLKRPYDGAREQNLSLSFDLNYRF